MQTTEQEARPPEARTSRPDQLNGIDRKTLFATIEAVKADPAKASCKFSATTHWQGGTVSNTEIAKYELGGQVIPQSYAIAIDEPNALLGTDTAPNPQMVLFAALNACVLNTFVINAAAKGIRIDHVELDLDGELDLRGFLGIDDATNPGYNELTMVCRVRGDGTQAQYEECLEAGTRYSPNFQSISRPVKVTYRVQTG